LASGIFSSRKEIVWRRSLKEGGFGNFLKKNRNWASMPNFFFIFAAA
jgi:hypothetical protein